MYYCLQHSTDNAKNKDIKIVVSQINSGNVTNILRVTMAMYK